MVTFNKIYLGSVLKGKVYAGSTLIFDGSTPSAPDVPTGLTTSDIQSDSITITWNAVSGADSYDIQFREQGQGWTNYNGETGTSRQFTGLDASTVYEFQVRATNTAGSSNYTSTENATTEAAGGAGLEAIINFWYQYTGQSGVNYTQVSKDQCNNSSVVTLLNLADGSNSSASYQMTNAGGTLRGSAGTSDPISNYHGYTQTAMQNAVKTSASGSMSTSKIAGLDSGKTYTIKVFSHERYNGAEMRVTVGGVQKTKGDTADTLLEWTGVSPSGGGEITITQVVNYMGMINMGTCLNLIHIIEE